MKTPEQILEEVELRLTQACIASELCKPKKRAAFLLGEMERIKEVIRNAWPQSEARKF